MPWLIPLGIFTGAAGLVGITMIGRSKRTQVDD
jgi:hypothetical protein